MSKTCWLGVDLGEKEFVAAVAVEGAASDWASLPHRSFKNTKAGTHAFVKWATRQSARHALGGICVEALGRLTWNWMEALNERLGPVSPVNPKRTAQFGKVLGIADKTDRVDACILAFFGLRMTPPARPLPDKPTRNLQELCHFRDAMETTRRAMENRLDRVNLPAWIHEEATVEAKRLRRLVKSIDKEIDALINSHPLFARDCALLESIPGVARLTAARVLSELGDLRQYTRTEITALAGLYPRQFQSGVSVRKRPRLTKTGNARLRSALYYPAMSARRFCPSLRRFADGLRTRGKSKKAVILAVERKLLLLMRAILINQTPYQDPAPAPHTDNPLAPPRAKTIDEPPHFSVQFVLPAAQDRATLASDPSGGRGAKTMRRRRPKASPVRRIGLAAKR